MHPGLRFGVIALCVVLAPVPGAAAAALPPPFVQIEQGPAGGTVWQGLVRDAAEPALTRPTLVYLPPHFSPARRYPVLYLLHGFYGGPYSILDGLQLAQVADEDTTLGVVAPFIAVMPPAGLTRFYRGEWAGTWERYVVRDVVPWVDAHLPTIPSRSGRIIAGLSAGGYGAADVGLRHLRLFGTIEAWSGYFTAPRDGPLAQAGRSARAAHDPSLLVRREAPLLRRLGTRFFLSCGSTRDRATAALTRAFARELGALRLPYRLWLGPGGHDGKLWRAQLPAALLFAVPASARG